MRFEGMGLEVQTRARNGFLALAARHPARFRVIDGHRPEAEVAAEVQAIAHDWLAKQRQTA
jgi:dTMP kinase